MIIFLQVVQNKVKLVWASKQSSPILEKMDFSIKKYSLKFADCEVPRPEFWSGLGIKPTGEQRKRD